MLERLRDRIRKMVNPSQRTLRIVSVSIVVLAMAWQQIEATRLGYRVESSRRQLRALKGRIALMQIELETSLSPAQLAAQARTRLGMQPASPETIRILDGGAILRARDSFFSRLLSRTWRSLTSGLNT